MLCVGAIAVKYALYIPFSLTLSNKSAQSLGVGIYIPSNSLDTLLVFGKY